MKLLAAYVCTMSCCVMLCRYETFKQNRFVDPWKITHIIRSNRRKTDSKPIEYKQNPVARTHITTIQLVDVHCTHTHVHIHVYECALYSQNSSDFECHLFHSKYVNSVVVLS